MEHMHPHLRLAASLILAAGLASACSGGSSGTAAAPAPDPDPMPVEPTTTRTPEGCTDASATCTVVVTAADGTMTTTVTTNVADATAMTNTRTVTVGSARTITVTDTRDGRGNRVDSTETCTVSGDSCTRTSLVEYTYTAAGGNTATSTVTRTYMMGRETRRVTVRGDTTTTVSIGYSSSNGGRTERTVTSTGTKVQTFSQFSGGTAASTVFTSTDGLTVTTANAAGMRVETVYANAADAQAGQNPRSMTVGTAAADADSGFRPGTTTTRTNYVANPAAAAGRTLVAWTETVALDADGDPGDPVITFRTYITTDAMGRETTRRTLAVNNGADAATDTVTVTTAYPEAGGTQVTTIDRTTGSQSWTQATTDAMGTVTTVVRVGITPSGDPITTTTANPAASDGSRTVDTVFGAGHASRSADGQRDRVKTNADGTTVTTMFTGAGVAVTDEAQWGTVSVTTRDENGVETMKVEYKASAAATELMAGGNAQVTTTTAYMTAGGSIVTTVTATRDDADSEYEDTRREVVTRDAMQRETLRVTADIDDGDESNQQTTVTVYAADGSSTATRTFSGGMGDLLTDTEIVKRNAAGAITDDIVVHPGVQDHTMVSDAQYAMIQTGMAARPSARTVMARPILHVNYSEDDAFNGLVGSPPAGGVNVEAEFIARIPTCAANGNCTFQGLSWYVEPFRAPEVRVYDPDNPNTRLYRSGQTTGTRNNYGGYDRANFVGNWGWHQHRTGESALLKLLAELLTVGGAGASATATASTDTTGDGGDIRTGRSYGGTVTIKPEAMTALEGRETFTHLETAGLARGVLGIGQQAKEVDSYMRLTERKADGSRPDDAVEAKVENYFGWMEHSMFTVRRVTATNVAGADFDWVNGAPAPDATDQVRAYVGMASGTPSDRPTERRATGMADPGTWTGEMIGVGTVQGERYRGAAKVTVDFDDNSVTTAFSGIRLALGGIDLATRDAMVRHVSDRLTDGISFTSDGIASNGSFTGRIADADRLPAAGIRANLSVAERADEITGRFYGSGANAEEVAGTFNAIGLALGRTGEEAMDDTRGDLVGAFGATRDPMTEVESN